MRLKRITILFSLIVIMCGLAVQAAPEKKTTGVVLLPFNARNAGSYAVLKDGSVALTEEGTPQGSPLSHC